MFKIPKITLLDVETSPILGLSWGVYDQTLLKVIRPSQIMSIAWKQLGSNESNVRCIADYSDYIKGQLDDKSLIQDVWSILDSSDVIIGQNSDKFDLPKINARFVIHNLPPPSSYKTVDTLKIAKKFFRFDSNKLDDLCNYLGLKGKVSHGGFSLWERCIEGDPKAWEKMKEYNLQDVFALEDVYLKLRPYATTHPDISLLTESTNAGYNCPTCLSTNVQKRGFSFTKFFRKQRYQCMECNSWSSGTPERIKQ